jgi:hypothetical protein
VPPARPERLQEPHLIDSVANGENVTRRHDPQLEEIVLEQASGAINSSLLAPAERLTVGRLSEEQGTKAFSSSAPCLLIGSK